jgi:hypothetical protein
MEQSKNTVSKLIKEINSNYITAKKANENLTNSMRIIAKDALSHSFEMEKSEITSAQEEAGNAIRAGFILFMSKRKGQKRAQKIRGSLEKKKNDEANLWNKWNMVKNKLKLLDAEDLFEIIKVNRQYGFSSVSRYILKD